MKNKSVGIPLIILTVLMYLIQLVLVIGLACVPEENEILGEIIVYISMIIGVIALFVGLMNIIIAVINFARNTASPTKITTIIKLILIPYYIINFIFWGILILITINPFLLWLFPFFVVISVFFTYAYMISTSSHNLSYVFRLLKDKKLEPTAIIVFAIISQFIFVLDIVGSIMLFMLLEKNKSDKNGIMEKNIDIEILNDVK